jgi:NTE family protein
MAAAEQAGGGSVDLVLEGGGVKGIGLVGALDTLDRHGFQAQNLAGASAGAIVAALVAAGYSVQELHGILRELRFEDFKDETWEGHIPLVGEYVSAVFEKGMYKGEYFLEWIGGLLAEKGVRTFADLVNEDSADEPDYRYRLQLIATDITAHELLRLPHDAGKFGVAPDELSVAEAVRMSMGIPIFFKPWRWRSKTDGKEHLIVDGGVLSNFPVWIFDSKGEPRWPTFGLMLVEPDPKAPPGANASPASDAGIVTYLKDLVSTMLEAHDRMYLENDVFVRTIPIPTLGVRTTEFDLSPQRADDLYGSGRAAAEEFLASWDFDAYKASFRSGAPPSSRR